MSWSDLLELHVILQLKVEPLDLKQTLKPALLLENFLSDILTGVQV